MPQKDKLEKINFYGNQLKEVDFAQLLSNFPNLQYINLENNPVKTKNLNSLTSTQFSRLIQGIKDKKIKVNSWKGTILMDLLEHAQRLVARGGSTHHSHMVALQTIIQQEKPNQKTKPILKTEQSSQVKPQSPNNTFYFIAGLVLIFGAVLAIGYWLGKNKRKKEFDY